MASAWGSWTARSSSQQRFRLGIDYTVSGTRITITRYKVQAAYSINQGVTLVRSGSMSGSVDFNFNTSGGVVNISGSGGAINGSRGSTYTIGGRVNGIYNGLVPTLSHRITIPAAAPDTPAPPTISNIGASSARLNWSPPDNNGASITQYGYRVERGGNFIDGGFTSGTSGNVSGLEPNTRYGARVRAQNSAGWSAFSSFRYFTTDAVEPGTPGMPSVSNITATGVRVTWGAANDNGASITDYQVRVERGGSTIKSANTGTSRNATFTGLDPNTKYGVRVRARNAAGWGSYTSFQYFTTKVQEPTAPSSLTADRQSDSRINLSWNNRSSSARPYDTQQIQRRTNDGGWVTIANVGGSASSYSDTGTSSNSKYEYAVRARNDAGTSSWAYAPDVYTTPAAPTNLIAEKNDDGSIEITWTNQARYPTGYRIVHQTNDEGAFDLLDEISGNVNTTTYTHTDPDPAVTHTYAVQATRGDLQSPLSTPSNTVQLQAPPDPPTILGPEGPQDATEDITLTWRHNPVDSSRQRQAQVRWRVAGDTSWTTEAIQTGRTAAFEVPADTWDNGTNIEWQVRTWGQDPDSSPWSATGLITLSGKPIAGIISPPDGGMVLEPTTVVQWSFFDPEGDPQSGWQVELLDADESVIETRSGSGTTDQIVLNALLEDQETYTVRVRVRDSVGQWSEWDTSTFDVQYPRPVPPDLDLEWMEQSGNINVAVTNYDPATDTFSRVNEVFNPRGVATSDLQAVRRNLITNPSFEAGDEGVTSGTHVTTELTNDVDGVFSGNQALAVTVLGNASPTSASVSQFIDLDSAGTWQVAASLRLRRVSGTTEAARLGITFYDGSDNPLGGSYSTPSALSTDSVRANPPLTHADISPDGAVRAEVTLNLISLDSGAPSTGIVQTDAWVADATLSDEPAPLALPYLDGDSDVQQDSLFADWTGEPNASTTVLQGSAPDYWTHSEEVYLYAQSGQEGMQVLSGREPVDQWIEPTPPITASAGDQVRLGVDVTPQVPMQVTFGGEEFNPPAGETTRLETTSIAEVDGPVDDRLTFLPRNMTVYSWTGVPHNSHSTWREDVGETFTNLVTNPRGRNTDGTVVVRENRIFNPGGEYGATGWQSNSGSSTASISDEQARTGQYSIKSTIDRPTNQFSVSTTYMESVPGGETVTCTFYLYSPETLTAPPDVMYWIIRDASAGEILDTSTYQFTPEPGVWQRHEFTYTVPEGSEFSHLYLRPQRQDNTDFAAGDAVYFDDTCLGGPGEPFDGDSWDGDTDFTPSWTGTPGASTSQLTAPKPVGWTFNPGIGYYSARHDAIAIIPDETGTLPRVYATETGTVSGRGYTWLVEVTADEPDGQGELSLGGTAAGGGVSGDPFGVLVGEWTTSRLPLVSAGGTVVYRINTSTLGASVPLYFRAALIDGTDTYDGEWFDGDVPDENVPEPLSVLAEVDRMIVETGPDLPDRRDYFDGDTPNRSLPSGHQSIYYWVDDPYAGPSQADYVPSEETVYNDIYRSIDGGEWELVATHVPVNGNFLDRTNAVVGENCYYAVAWSSEEAAARGETECLTIYNGAVNYCPPGEHSSLSAWVSGGENYALYCRAFFDLSIDEETGAETRTLHRFAGRTYPVEFSGRGLSQTIDLSFTTRRERDWRGEEVSTLEDWRELLRLPGPHLLRTYKGHRFEVSVSPIKANGVEGEIEECTLTLTRTAVDLTQVPDPEQGGDDG